MGFLVLRGDMDTSQIPNPEAIYNWQLIKNEKLIFSNGISLGIQTTFKEGQQKTHTGGLERWLSG